jgi:membrane protein YdbS with pleckstrin-like domain
LTEPVIIKGSGIKAKTKPRIIKPVNRLLWKYYLYVVIAFVSITIGVFLLIGFIEFMATLDSSSYGLPNELIEAFFILYFGACTVIVLICIVCIPIYVRSMVYSVHGDEIVVKKGLLNITEKHVPYRTVTNLNTKAGILDRFIFGMGSVEIQTAGGKGSSGYGPEEILEGLRVYREVRDYIITQLYNFRKGGGQVTGDIEEIPVTDLQDSVIEELRSIKTILKGENK